MQNFELSYKKIYKPFSNNLEDINLFSILKKILFSNKDFLYVAALYSLVISLLTVATPISIQLLINSVANTGMLQPIITLGIILLVLLIFSSILYSLQIYTIEVFNKRFIAQISADICKILIGSNPTDLEKSNSLELVNRFFDVGTIQKTLPKFLFKILGLILQGFIGLVLVSFYHPFFLIFSLMLILAIYIIFKIYFRKCYISACYESRRKYDIAGWLEDIAQNVMIFKSPIGQKYAKYKTNELTKRYFHDREIHFTYLFKQSIFLLAIYALFSSFLLMLGGFLVLKGQLTLGQLVAAELILSALLYSISQLGRDFENIYDFIAACEKLSNFYNIPQEPEQINKQKISSFKNIKFVNAISSRNNSIKLNIELENHKKYLIYDRKQDSQRFLIDVLGGFDIIDYGEIKIDDQNLSGFDLNDFREKIIHIDSKPLIEGTLIENLTFYQKNIEKTWVNKILSDLNLDKSIDKFEEKLDLRIIPSGWPFSEQEAVLIKVARALILKKEIIILSEIFDIIDYKTRQNILHYLQKESKAMIIYFSNHNDENNEIFDKIIYI